VYRELFDRIIEVVSWFAMRDFTVWSGSGE